MRSIVFSCARFLGDLRVVATGVVAACGRGSRPRGGGHTRRLPRPFSTGLIALVVALLLTGVVRAGEAGTSSVPATQPRLVASTLHVRLQARRCATASPDSMAAAEAVIARRILALGVRGARVTTVGRCGIDVVATGVTDQRQFLATIAATGQLVIYGMGTLPLLTAGATFPYTVTYAFQSYCHAAKSPRPCILIVGSDLDRSKISVGRDTLGAPVVNAGAKGAGADRLSAYTGAHIGQHMAIVLDGTVITDPTIQARLATYWRITGLRSVVEATTLAISLTYGALPIAFTIVGGYD